MDELLRRAFDFDPGLALREESFGALVYHFGTRRLVFLKTPELTEVVRSLPEAADLGCALRAVGIPEDRWPGYARAIADLADGGLLKVREVMPA